MIVSTILFINQLLAFYIPIFYTLKFLMDNRTVKIRTVLKFWCVITIYHLVQWVLSYSINKKLLPVIDLFVLIRINWKQMKQAEFIFDSIVAPVYRNNRYTLDKRTKDIEEIFNDIKLTAKKQIDEKNIQKYVQTFTLQFPKEWEQQAQDIQTFIVNKNTIEFANVQNSFTSGVIVQLIRIQNKPVYKKFLEEREYLEELNEGKPVKQMFLFHGTRYTDPKTIYEDKEECFNINYTSQSNLLGRGIYFAERSEYSVDYSHKERLSNVLSMFYCQVMVGESQKCLKHDGNIRDTNFKDSVKRLRYESMTDFLQNSNVFVVYKNRRAYPLYLIKYKLNKYQYEKSWKKMNQRLFSIN